MIRAAAIALTLLAASPAAAQVSVSGGTIDPAPIVAAIARADAALATAQAAQASIPQPATSSAPMETVTGAGGSAGTYWPGNRPPLRITRTGSCTTVGTTGACSASWDGSVFPAGVTPKPVGEPSAVNTTAMQPMQCNYISAPTISGFSVKCWFVIGTTLPSLATSLLGLAITPFTPVPAGTVVNATAIPAS